MAYSQFDYSLSSVAAAQQAERLRIAQMENMVLPKQGYPNDTPVSFILLFKIAPVRLEAVK
jgi:hypothetical protein